MSRLSTWILAALSTVSALSLQAAPPAPERQTVEEAQAKSGGCVSCHTTTDRHTMHQNPGVVLGCVDCHGGDAVVKAEGVKREVDGERYLALMRKAHVLPQLRVIGNVSYLRFVNTTVLGVLRNQAPPSRDIGLDVSGAVQWRPFMTQNIVINASAAALFPGQGLKQLYDEDKRGPQYSMLVNVIATF